MMKRFLPKGSVTPSVFCIIDIRPDRQSIPTTAYKVVEEVEDGKSSGSAKAELKKNFAHVPSVIGAIEAEEIGVEHLLRDINDPTISTVSTLIQGKMAGLATLTSKLVEMKDYLENILNGNIQKVNQDIIANMQTILNLLPNLNVEELVKAVLVKTNDLHMVIYLSSLIRSVIALHDLVNNKIRYNEASSSYLSGFSSWASSKISTSTTAAPTTAPAPVPQPSKPVMSSNTPATSASLTVAAPAPKPAPKFSSLSLQDAGVGGGSGWSNDDDDDFAGIYDNNTSTNTKGNTNTSLIPSWASEKDDDDFMSQFEKKDFIRPRSAVGVGSKLNTPSRVTASSRRRAELVQKKNKETKVSVKKLTMDSGIDDGWDDF